MSKVEVKRESDSDLVVEAESWGTEVSMGLSGDEQGMSVFFMLTEGANFPADRLATYLTSAEARKIGEKLIALADKIEQ